MKSQYEKASRIWHAMEPFRRERERCKRYVYGDQWNDRIDIEGNSLTEREFLSRQGHVPLTNNILRRILRNVVGLFRSQYRVPTLSARDSPLTKQQVRDINSRRRQWFHDNNMEELAPRLLEEFLISGIVAVKVTGGKILPVTPQNFFFSSNGYDPRGGDVDLIGELHHIPYSNLLQKFCKSGADYRLIKSLYGDADRGMCRVAEVWHLDISILGVCHDKKTGRLRVFNMEGQTEKSMEERSTDEATDTICRSCWRQTWYASDGTVLAESHHPEGHPYEFKAYPYLDGEVHSYISDLIDQQRYVNRLITLYDFIMKSSAKGVLLFPDESIPDGMNLSDVAEEWSCFNGVIPYKAKPGVPMPSQVSTNSTNIGITELLKIEMQMLEDISGVSPTLQGKLVTNSTSGTLFAQQNQAAQTSLLDVVRTFSDFLGSLANRGQL